jgi:hypothetical protein
MRMMPVGMLQAAQVIFGTQDQLILNPAGGSNSTFLPTSGTVELRLPFYSNK